MSFGVDVFSGWRALRKFIFGPIWRLLHPHRKQANHAN
jgi:hypothetical protein